MDALKAGRWRGDGTLKARRKGYQRKWNRAERGGRREANPSPPSTPHRKDHAMVDDELGPDNRSYRRMVHGSSPRAITGGSGSRAELPGGGEGEFPKSGSNQRKFQRKRDKRKELEGKINPPPPERRRGQSTSCISILHIFLELVDTQDTDPPPP